VTRFDVEDVAADDDIVKGAVTVVEEEDEEEEEEEEVDGEEEQMSVEVPVVISDEEADDARRADDGCGEARLCFLWAEWSFSSSSLSSSSASSSSSFSSVSLLSSSISRVTTKSASSSSDMWRDGAKRARLGFRRVLSTFGLDAEVDITGLFWAGAASVDCGRNASFLLAERVRFDGGVGRRLSRCCDGNVAAVPTREPTRASGDATWRVVVVIVVVVVVVVVVVTAGEWTAVAEPVDTGDVLSFLSSSVGMI
jgi:hypothetical protein